MWTTTLVLLVSCICQSYCTVTWNSPINGHNETVPEDKTAGETILSLNATTAGTSVAYSVESEVDTFGIQNMNELYLKAELDYEGTNSYDVRISAIDSSTNEEADITITVTVTDVNDNPPAFTSPTSVTIPDDTSTGSVVYTAAASDADTVGSLTFSIKSGNDNQDFIINATTGEITLNAALDIATKAEYDLTLEATDGVNTEELAVTIYLTDVIWRSPSEDLNTSLLENTPEDSSIMVLDASNAAIYTLTQTGDEFRTRQLTNGSTELYLAQSLDREITQSYTVAIRALASGINFADITINIEVTDVNDEPPVFSPDSATIDLSKDTETDTVVFTAQVTDPDITGTHTFSITDGNTNSTFSINDTTGELSLANQLDPAETYNIDIQATDGVFNATLSLGITVNEVVWVEPAKGTTDEVPENSIQVVTNLTAETATTYTIQSVIPDHDNFAISNGQLTITSQLDYENTTAYTFILKAIDSNGKSATVAYNVNVTDQNDITPVFQSDAFYSLPENAEVGSVLITVSATDEDTVGTVMYSITGGNTDDTFVIDSTSGELSLNRTLSPSTVADLTYNLIIEADDTVHQKTQSLNVQVKTIPVLVLPENGTSISESVNTSVPFDVLDLTSTDLDGDPNPVISISSQSHAGAFYLNEDNTKLLTTTNFDFEDTSEYNVTLRVEDSSNLKLSSEGTLNVYLINENDEKPVFTSNTTLDLADDTATDIIIYTAAADDPDNPDPTTITFSITAGDTNGDFNMNANGSLTLNDALNASATLMYSLVIQASDTVNVETLTLVVNLVTEPQIDTPDPNITLDEGTYTSQSVWTLSSTDIDNDANATYQIVEQSEPGKFALNAENTELITGTSVTFDYESETSYTVTLSVTDSSSLQRSSTATVTVYINNINDEPPQFASPTELEIREDQTIDVPVYVAMTTDPDSLSAEVAFSIIDGNTDNVFNIDSMSGNLTLAQQLTSNSSLTYNLVIQANDTVNTANLTLDISVVTAPVFAFPDMVTISENTDTSGVYEVLVLNATDRDGDVNFTYGLVSQSDADTFAINGDGKLITTASFDFENKTSFNVTLNVTDDSTFKMSSEETLVIYITDENDNAPEFQSNSSVEISEFTEGGVVLYTAVTTDIDTESTVTYAIIGGNADNKFSMNETSGEITLLNSLQPVGTLEHVLELQANDSVQTSTLNLTVSVKTAPEFTISPNLTIPENIDTTDTVSLLPLESSDADGDTGVFYAIAAQSVDGVFGISDDNKNLTTNATFDYETTKEYTVMLRATDDSAFSLSSTFNFTIYIEDVNDLSPVFISDDEVDIPETTSTGEVFFTAQAEDNDTVGSITYSIAGGTSDGLFSIDSDSGNLTLAMTFGVNTSLTQNLIIQANDTVNTQTLNFTVNIKTAPVLTPLNINISENGADVIWNLTSSDIDGDDDPTYTIVDHSEDIFYINYTVSAVVINSTSLDYETTTQYTFVVMVVDSSALQLSSSVTFTVSVINENDEPPVFNSTTEVQLREDTDTGTVIYTAEATDADNLGMPLFSIIDGNDDNIFQIDENTGSITLIENLNASLTLTHTLLLQANDGVNVDTLNVTFNLITAPMLVVPDSVTVNENVVNGTDVLVFNVTDLDGDTDFDFELVNQSHPDTFKISDDNTKLVTNSAIDYDSTQSYSVEIRVTDRSVYNMTSTSLVSVDVIDINDEKPVFTSPNYIRIAETTPNGTIVYTANTTDVDTIGTTTYSVIGNADFTIDPSTGDVTLVTELQPATEDDLTKLVTILANDSVNTDTLNLTVNILTVPVLHVADVFLSEDINTTAVYTVWTINATDLDGDNMTFTIDSQSEAGVFQITDNAVVTSADFDFETTKNYSVDINVTDSSELALSSVETLNIFITDVNDNVPVFTSNDSVYILQTASAGEEIYTATTNDVDTVGNVSYAITAGDDSNNFAIDMYSGVVTLQNELNPQTESDILYNLLIEANDTVNVAELNLTVNVRTVPYLNITNQSIAENTDTTGNYTVWTIDWVDLDGDQEQTIDVVVESVDGTFQVDGNSKLVTSASFDYESITNYTATIRITDPYGLTSNDTITVFITDVNDVAPEFKGNTTLDLWEETATGEVVYMVSTDDPDTSGTVEYSFKDGNAEDKFEIDAASGNLTVKNSLDFDTTTTYTLRIKANDSINIGDFNLTVNIKTSPVLNFTGEVVEVSEAASSPYELLTLNATDRDGDTSEYTITSQSVDYAFMISDGKLVTNTTFDFEDVKTYDVTVKATDSSLGLTSEDTLTVYVTDVNDNAPTFNSDTNLEIREDTPTDEVVYTANATDPDTVGSFSYAIIDGNTNTSFAIDTTSGNLTLASQLDPTVSLSYNLSLEVNDTLLASTMILSISVKTTPMMVLPENVTINENTDTSNNYTVLELDSTDLDGDNVTYDIVNQSSSNTFFISADNSRLLTSKAFNYSDENEFNVTIRVTDMSSFAMSSSATLQVFISDVNNVAPLFTSPSSLDIAETQATDSAVYTAVVFDPDTDGEISFSIIGGNTNDTFDIDSDSGNLTLVKALQPSVVLGYELEIQATDTVNFGSINVSVSVITVPEIVLPGHNLTIQENLDTSGTHVVLEFNTTDLDGDQQHVYTILSQSIADTFDIVNDSLVTTADFDYENETSYEIVVQVMDMSVFNLSSSVTIMVYIVDENDVSPEFTSDTEIFIAETQQTGEPLYTAVVTDPDTIGSVTFGLTDGDRNEEFLIGMETGELTLRKELNPQNVSDLLYFLMIEANDTANTVSLNLTVRIRTVPYLKITNQSIQENTDTTGNYSVWTIEWSDLDGDLNPTLDVVAESVDGTFQVVNNSVLITSADFDYENTTEYTATIRITDAYNLTSNATFTLNVNDVNDVTPVFTNNATLDLWEGTPTGEVVFTVAWEDPDTIGTPMVYITSGNSGEIFELEPTSGNLTLDKELNFDITSTYNLQFKVNDSINTATFNLTVNVKTSPELNFTDVTANVPENASISSEVLVLNATDRDGDTVFYSIISQSVDGIFDIDSDKLVLNATVDYEDIKNYTATIRATDSSLGLTAEDTLTVLVTDINDNAPTFTSRTELEIREDTVVGTGVYIVEAEDVDTVGVLSFSIEGGNTNETFAVDSNSGNVTLIKALDPNEQLSYNLVFEVSDDTNTNNMTLEVRVKTAPKMVFPENVTIPEDTDTSDGYTVLVLNSTDLDGDESPRYEIVNQSDPDAFSISLDNSRLLLNASLDYLVKQNYNVTIRVTDSSNFTMSSTDTLNVYISDVNNVNPTFISPETLEIPENQPQGSVIYTAKATDPDQHGEILYAVVGGDDDGYFSIDSQSGNLTLAKPLQPQDILDYTLEIQANDSVNIALLNLSLSVKTIPALLLPDEPQEISEDRLGTFTVLELNSTDLDGDQPNYSISYQTVNGTFEIINETLLVKVADLDYETLQTYVITIRVTDDSDFALSSSGNVTVSVLDANDLAPVFTSANETYLPESTQTGTVVYTAETYDNDTGDEPVTYLIAGGNTGGDFSIDEDSGAVTLENEFRPGTVPKYNLTLQASDSVNHGVLNLIVNVVTVPTLLFPAERITIEENVNKSRDSLVWICAAQDVDGDTDLEYAILTQSVNNTFVLSDDNKRLLTTETFDFEENQSYDIVISVTDSSPLKLSSEGTLTVYIENVNDVEPVFTSPASFNLEENEEIGSVVYTAVTEDPDGFVTYSLIDGNTDNDFEIDAESGNVTLVNALNDTRTENYTLVIQANDTVNTVNFNVSVRVFPDIDECEPEPCKNGTCIDEAGAYRCECVPGYNGTDCDNDINECATSPCENGATCHDLLNEYNCTCVSGFEGVNCSIDIDDCATSPCENGATCNDLIDEYNCTCVPGYEGDNCSINTDECASDPCNNNATCNDLINSYTCTCVDGYEGINCENDTDECEPVKCENGATCQNLLNAFNCDCLPGYIGTYCQQECTEGLYGDNCGQPCNCHQNGTVSCDHVNGTCYCNQFYNGTRCDNDINECETNNICNNTNEGCHNTVGGYICDCLINYERNTSSQFSECIAETTATTTTALPSNRRRVRATVRLSYVVPLTDNLDVKATYDRYVAEVLSVFQAVLQLRIRILRISRGSLIVEYEMISSEDDAGKVAGAIANLATNQDDIKIFNQPAPVLSLDVNNMSVPVGEQYSDKLACDIYETSYGSCTGKYACTVKDRTPGCEFKDTEDNLPLILGLGIGIPTFFVGLALVVLCIAYYNNKRKILHKRSRRDNREVSEFYKMPVRANTGPPTWPFVASPEYAEYTQYGDYSSREDSQNQMYAEDYNDRPYDNRVQRDSYKNTWDYLSTHINPGEPYHIKRPSVQHYK